MDFIYHINCFHTLLKESYAVFGNLIGFLPCIWIITVNSHKKKIPGQIVDQ